MCRQGLPVLASFQYAASDDKNGGIEFRLISGCHGVRRMIGSYIMTEQDCLGTRATPKCVGMGSYTMDSHNVQRYVTPAGHVQNEGDIGVAVPPYRIAYGTIVPKKDECTNLLVPVTVSASHIAYGSVRMEPVFMILGQSAATAAVMSLEQDCAVQDLDYEQLRRKLLEDGQILE
jgi:hypothetical protein